MDVGRHIAQFEPTTPAPQREHMGTSAQLLLAGAARGARKSPARSWISDTPASPLQQATLRQSKQQHQEPPRRACDTWSQRHLLHSAGTCVVLPGGASRTTSNAAGHHHTAASRVYQLWVQNGHTRCTHAPTLTTHCCCCCCCCQATPGLCGGQLRPDAAEEERNHHTSPSFTRPQQPVHGDSLPQGVPDAVTA
jgi:hypothetical protein